MWKLFFTPEILFLMGMLQSLFPYIIWYVHGLNKSYFYTTTYIPVFIWVFGYLFFLIGAAFVKDPKPVFDENFQPISIDFFKKIKWNKFNLVLISIFGLTCIFIFQAIKIYDGIPLLQYANETATVSDANDIQTNAGGGQFGVLLVLLLFLNSLIVMFIIKNFESGRQDTLIFLAIAFVEIFGSLMAGKRQGIMITLMFILCGLSLRFQDPLKPIAKIMGIPSNKLIKFLILIAIGSLMVWLMGAMMGLRNGNAGSASGTDEILTYLELPLINLESQCEAIGFGFDQKSFLYPFVHLLPYTLTQGMMLSIKDLPFHPEPTASAGFYGELHWGFGIYGIIVFSFIAGLICKYLYSRSSSSIFHFLAYCQISWTLISAHSYNHFLTLMFIPVPVFIIFVFSKIIDDPTKLVQSTKP
jgi:oligosaccharide repeat unit polymerase